MTTRSRPGSASAMAATQIAASIRLPPYRYPSAANSTRGAIWPNRSMTAGGTEVRGAAGPTAPMAGCGKHRNDRFRDIGQIARDAVTHADPAARNAAAQAATAVRSSAYDRRPRAQTRSTRRWRDAHLAIAKQVLGKIERRTRETTAGPGAIRRRHPIAAHDDLRPRRTAGLRLRATWQKRHTAAKATRGCATDHRCNAAKRIGGVGCREALGASVRRTASMNSAIRVRPFAGADSHIMSFIGRDGKLLMVGDW